MPLVAAETEVETAEIQTVEEALEEEEVKIKTKMGETLNGQHHDTQTFQLTTKHIVLTIILTAVQLSSVVIHCPAPGPPSHQTLVQSLSKNDVLGSLMPSK